MCSNSVRPTIDMCTPIVENRKSRKAGEVEQGSYKDLPNLSHLGMRPNNGTYHDVALAGSLATDPPGLRGRVSLVFVIHSGGNEPPIFAALTL